MPRIGKVAFGIAGLAALAATGWFILNTPEDREAVTASVRREIASARWALGGEVRPSSVCEIAKAGRAMDGHKVRVRVQFSTDHFEHSNVVDYNCPQQRIDIVDGSDIVRDAAYVSFEKLINSGDLPARGPDIFDLEVTGTVERPAKSAMVVGDRSLIAVHQYLSAKVAKGDITRPWSVSELLHANPRPDRIVYVRGVVRAGVEGMWIEDEGCVGPCRNVVGLYIPSTMEQDDNIRSFLDEHNFHEDQKRYTALLMVAPEYRTPPQPVGAPPTGPRLAQLVLFYAADVTETETERDQRPGG